MPSTVPYPGKTLNKVAMADHLRLMRDNERILGQQFKVKQELDRRHLAMDQDKAPQSDAAPESEDVGDINIDSPTTNYYGAPAAAPPSVFPTPAAAAGPSLLSRLAPMVVGATLGAGGVGLGSFLSKQPAPAPVTIPDHPDLRWRLLLPDEQPKGATT